MTQEIEIPEGYEAKIENNKVIFVPKESEDERIRKEIVGFIEQVLKDKNVLLLVADRIGDDIPNMIPGWLAYLEKQKDEAQKQFNLGVQAGREEAMYEMEKEQKPQIKLVFPKFRVGDIIQHIPLEKWDTTKKITHIDETGYYFDHSHQGDTVSGGFIGFSFENDYELVEQKPAEWSKKDEKTLKELICYIENWKQRTKDKSYNHTLWSSDINECDRFLSLLNSIHPQPEWSEENDTAIHLACEFIRHHSRKKDTIGGIYCDELVMMLKSLRPQPHWKPSKEQMDILDKVYHYLWADRNATAAMQDGLGDFIDDLKSL